MEARLGRFAAGLDFHSLPGEVIERAKEILLDTIGIMWRATSAPSLAALRRELVRRDSGRSTVFGSPYRADPPTAALLNGALPTVTQYDEGHRPSRGHPAIHIIPAALAVAEEGKISGKDFLVALVAGYEVAARIGLAVFPMAPQIHPHGNWSTIGAAVSVGKILSFSSARFVDLINSISTLALFTWRKAATSGATIHHLSPGLGAHHAVIAALATKAGLSGPSSCLERYFLSLSCPHPRPDRLTAGLGRVYEILHNYFKAYPACAQIHSSIEALEGLMAGHGLAAEEIIAVEVRTFPAAADLDNPTPANMLSGIFSIPYCLGMWLVHRKLPIGSIAAESPPDPEVLEMASRVWVVRDETLRPSYPQGRPARVKVRLKNGSEYEHFVPLPRERPTRKELEEKFMEMVEWAAGKKRGEELRKIIMNLEDLSHMGQLSGLLRPPDSRKSLRGRPPAAPGSAP